MIIPEQDLQVSVYTGGFMLNPHVRLKHLPTGLSASCDDTTSKWLNYDAAMRILKAKLAERE